MKVIVDLQSELSPDLQVLYYLYCIGDIEAANDFETKHSSYPGNPEKIPYKQFLIDNNYILSNGLINKRKLNIISTDELIHSILEDYRNKFKNKKTGAMGDLKAIIKKFKKFFEEYPEYCDKQLIMAATDRYINSCARDNFKYLKQADYVIYKNDNDGGGTKSTLAVFCEEVVNCGNDTNTSNSLTLY